MLSEKGIRTALYLGAETVGETLSHTAVVIALKSRSIPAKEACDESLEALAKLRHLGARQILFKYCSTFDSSADGNIGPVAEALMDELDVPFTVAVPALPVNGRTQYQGYLFVGDRLLSETHMRHHPIHPMTDSNLVRHLQAQTSKRVGLLPHSVVRAGAARILAGMKQLEGGGVKIALVDVLSDDDLLQIADAVINLPLITGGSGLGMALPAIWERRGLLTTASDRPPALPGGGVLILSGSCSTATLGQIADVESSFGPGSRMDVLRLLDDYRAEVARLHHEAAEGLRTRGWALVYSSTGAEERRDASEAARERGCTPDVLSAAVESAHQELARRAILEGGVRHIVVAGGETSGSVASALGLQALEVDSVLDPGVPVLRPLDDGDLTVTFKAGNFGSPDFFSKALRYLMGSTPT
jgi:uncharacterized protein YgbK (DUF1537 family)